MLAYMQYTNKAQKGQGRAPCSGLGLHAEPRQRMAEWSEC